MELCRITVADNPDLRGGAKGQHSGVSLTKGVIDGAHRDGAHRPLRFTMAVGNADAGVGGCEGKAASGGPCLRSIHHNQL